MELDYQERRREFLSEVNKLREQLIAQPEAALSIIKNLASEYKIELSERDNGEQLLSLDQRSWQRYQIEGRDPGGFEGGVLGQSDENLQSAYIDISRNR